MITIVMVVYYAYLIYNVLTILTQSGLIYAQKYHCTLSLD